MARANSNEGPQVTTATAFGLLVLYALIYVLPFYASPSTRPSATLSRDDTTVIRHRIRCVSLSCTICTALTLLILHYHGASDVVSSFHSLGYWPLGLLETAKSLLLTALLFIGPLFDHLVADSGWDPWIRGRMEPIRDLLSDWMAYRNIVAGPLTEEILFRSAAVPLLLLSPASPGQVIFLSPLCFGLAHVHHFYEFRLTHPRVPVHVAAIRSLFQLSFTTLFGAFATFIFVRTGSLLAAVVVHAFCNSVGVPRVGGRVEGPVGPVWAWTVVYHALLVVGAVAFYWNLWPLTESDMALMVL